MRLRTSIRVLVVDDQRIIRRGIRNLLTGRTGVQVVGEADCGESAVRMSKRLRPGVVLMDLVMPGIGGVETIRRIVRLGLDTRVFVLTSFASDFDVRPALDAGAIGILSKDAEPEVMLRAIKDAWRMHGRRKSEDSQGDKRVQQGVRARPR
jgi:DNA-binding NarL/FixJ family response regulator